VPIKNNPLGKIRKITFGDKIYYNSRDIEFFLGDYFLLVHPVDIHGPVSCSYNSQYHRDMWVYQSTASVKDTNLCHCNKSNVLLAEFMQNATISTAKDQHRFICIVLMSDTAQRLGVYQVTLTQHYKYNQTTCYNNSAADTTC